MEELNRRDAFKAAAVAGITAIGASIAAAPPEKPTAIIRLSAVGKEMFIPDELGNLVTEAYDPQVKIGKLKREADPKDPDLEKKGSQYWQHFQDAVSGRSKALPKENVRQPVVIMVHGFMADPRDKIHIKRAQSSDNPHDFSFHYNPAEQRHWRHTASWPLGLGLKEDDSGQAGLGIAFGWNSQPDLFTDHTKLLKAITFKVVPRLGFASALNLTKAVTESVRIASQFGIDRGAEGNDALYDELNAVLKEVEPDLAKVAQDKNLPTYNETYLRAPAAGIELVNVIRVLTESLPEDQPIDLFCHSLGSRVVIQALCEIAARGGQTEQPAQATEFQKLLKRIGRVIFLGGAEHSKEARIMMKAVHAAQGDIAFYNFTSAVDRVLDIFAERLFSAESETTPVIGLRGLQPTKAGLEGVPPKWIQHHWFDLELDDDPVAKKWLIEKRQMTVEGAHVLGILNHWYYFTSKDNLKLYSQILRARGDWEIPKLLEEIASFRNTEGSKPM